MSKRSTLAFTSSSRAFTPYGLPLQRRPRSFRHQEVLQRPKHPQEQICAPDKLFHKQKKQEKLRSQQQESIVTEAAMVGLFGTIEYLKRPEYGGGPGRLEERQYPL